LQHAPEIQWDEPPTGITGGREDVIVACSGLETSSASDRFPLLRPSDTFRGRLPTKLSSFVGREAEQRDLAHALAHSRLLTLVGPGGMGKTRLALAVAASAVERFGE